MPHTRLIFVFYFILCWTNACFSQRYDFKQYDIEDGLAQSQVTAITQDHHRRLWIATLGGLSCFNGNQFANFGKIDGLSSNFILSLVLDQENNLSIGTENGLSTYKKDKISNVKGINKWTDKLVAGSNGELYGLLGKNVFKIKGTKVESLVVTNDTTEFVTALKKGQKGEIWAAVFQKGVYRLQEGKWKEHIAGKQVKDLIITDLLVDKLDQDKIWLLTTVGIFIAERSEIKQVYQKSIKSALAIVQDETGTIWLGTNKGAWYVSKQQLIHFNADNGFTDNKVNTVFKDAENNIWLGTDGSGLFRFSNKNYVTFDESQGLRNGIVMAISPGGAPNEIWLGTYDGLYSHKDNKIKKIVIPSEDEKTQRINFLFKDRKNRIWIATEGGGCWVYKENRFHRIDRKNHSVSCNTIMEDRQGNIWLSTNVGCYVINNRTKQINRVTTQAGTSLLEISNDLVISSTQNGAYLIRDQTNINPLEVKPLYGTSILCMIKSGDHVFFGTADNGLILWNYKTGKTKQFTTKQGLLSDHIYSLLLDKKKEHIWIGTGRGINRLNTRSLTILKNENDLVVECNQNAILEHKGNIWIGTTKGVVVFNTGKPLPKINKPHVFIKSVNILPQQVKGHESNRQVTYRETELQSKLTLPHNENHLNISFTGIYFSNPKAVLYRYKLIGLDENFSSPNVNSSISYTALPPGKYVFRVKAVTISGIESALASFAFEIKPPYYQTTIFRIFVAVIVLLSIALSAYIVITLSERQRRLRLKIKLEEQFKIRKQTAEDFHDDIGNKLTRISVLSEVLSSMTDKNDLEKRAIIGKIKTNVNELYRGTKDILWSLNPKNDTLGELLAHIREFGQEMFNETPITFDDETFIGYTEQHLSLEMSRNILMIFKEAINNTLKYSKADLVKFRANVDQNGLEINLEDNGVGFDLENVNYGQGINNMKVRALRIKGNLEICSNKNGTSILLAVKI